jgi:hypothetical protein
MATEMLRYTQNGLNTSVACRPSDFERERERSDRLRVDVLRASLNAQSRQEPMIRSESELIGSRPCRGGVGSRANFPNIL